MVYWYRARHGNQGVCSSNPTYSSIFTEKIGKSKSLATENRGSVGDARNLRNCNLTEKEDDSTQAKTKWNWKNLIQLLLYVKNLLTQKLLNKKKRAPLQGANIKKTNNLIILKRLKLVSININLYVHKFNIYERNFFICTHSTQIVIKTHKNLL